MTTLEKPIHRVTRDEYNVLFLARSKARRIVVTLKPHDVLEFREQGRRDRFAVPIANAFRYAVNCAALAVRREKAAKALKQKQARKRAAAERRLVRQARRAA